MLPSPRILTIERSADRITLLAVDKPSGWVAHATRPDEPADLRAWLQQQGHPGCAPLHRLDRGTSGVLLFSPDPAIRAQLGAELTAGTITKRYLALVIGHARRKGIIRTALDGRRAVTRYGLAERLGGFSLLRVRPQTGRKHQIRRHLHSIGLPVVGDDRYRPARFRAVPGYPERLFLHAYQLILPDGRTFESPLPQVLSGCLEALRGGPRGEAPQGEALQGEPPQGGVPQDAADSLSNAPGAADSLSNAPGAADSLSNAPG
ncbi:MAG TPA: RluA family pseudouridine synthase, partial [Deltaproteobacteria bacterium]|nr:RluA family pseudouridine synthase [Deltaproteobacteria bacterium]